MSLSSSLYTGVSGLKGHGQQMGVIGNNISNVSTVGFKGSRMHFEDFISQDVNTSAGVGQVGRGVTTGAVLGDFQQGALETTNEATDVAIGGDGFFVVSPKGAEEQYYTRAGNFRFDKDGYLVDTKGNAVQGWSVRQDRDTEVAADDEDQVMATESGVQIQGVPTDIRLDNFQSPPEATTQVDKMVNLDSNSMERSTSPSRQEVSEIVVGPDTLNMLVYDDAGTEIYLHPETGHFYDGDNSTYSNWAMGEDGRIFDHATTPDSITNLVVTTGAGTGAVEGWDMYEFETNGDPRTAYLDPATGYLRDNTNANTIDDDSGEPLMVVDGNIVVATDADPANSPEVDGVYEDGNPFFAMFNHWNANEDEPLPDARYAYQSTLKVYDANGSAYNLTTYFDPVRDPNVRETAGGNRHWEYMTTVNPINDNRDGMVGSEKRGVLMTGSLTFNAAGDIIGQSAFTLNDQNALNNPDQLENWTQAQFSQNGYPVFTANFLGENNASFTGDEDARNIEMNFGLRNRTGDWTPGGAADASEMSVNSGDDFDQNLIPGFADSERSALSTTHYSSASTTLFQTQDGYTSGFLQNISIDRDGVLTGRYSNGQVLDLYALTLADFNSTSGLRREGGNLFSETRSSGPAITGLAGTGSLGSISGNSLEMSNVDLATEFVKMITSEKGFQANSKTITTTDQMLNVLIQMKR